MRVTKTRATAAAAGLLATALLASACGSSGGSDVGPAPGNGGGSDPSDTAASESPSASASPSEGSTTVARSDLEDRPQVKAVRAWAAGVAEEVNARSSSHAQTRAVTTRRGARTLPQTYAGDYGLRYPGPLPFTPLAVTVSGRTAQVPACIQATGWAVNAKGLSPQPNVLKASTFVLKRVSGAWKLDRITGRQQSCADVTVKGYAS